MLLAARGAASGFCLKSPDTNRVKLCSNRERVLEHSLRMPKIPPIFIWQRKGHCRNRPQNIDHNLQEAPPECTKRLQGMLMQLHCYNLDVVYKPRPEMYVSDTLSRATLPHQGPDTPHVRHAVFATQKGYAQLDQAQHLNVTDSVK